MLGVLPFFPFTAALALTLHFFTCKYKRGDTFDFCHMRASVPDLNSSSSSSGAAPPSSVFFIGGSVEFPNLSFTSELADSASPQFHLQAQALDNYVSGSADTSRDTPSSTPRPSSSSVAVQTLTQIISLLHFHFPPFFPVDL